jgi:hypothetical protein
VLWAGDLGDPHGQGTDPGLLRIEVEDVLDALAALPGGRPFTRRTSGARTLHGV